MIQPTHDTVPTAFHGVLTDHVHAHLDTILASPPFAATRRLKSLLRYLVLHALDGTATHLNEYRIALEAFDRTESFDPSIDPIVRVEISRLRDRLKRYYDQQIVDHGISFALPRGTYALSITESPASAAPVPPPRDSSRIAIGVSPLHAAPRTPEIQRLSTQITNELMEILANERYLSTVTRTASFEPRLYRRFTIDTQKCSDVDFIVAGSIRPCGPLLYASVHLIDVHRGVVHLLGNYVYDLLKTLTVRMDLPSAITTDIRWHLLTSRSVSRPEFTPLNRDAFLWYREKEQTPTVIPTILEAATEAFASHGYVSATLNAIAIRAKVADRFVLNLFGTKNNLFVESVRMTANRALDLPRLQKLATDGELKRKVLQGTLLASIRRWYPTLSIERGCLSIYAGLKENIEYQQLIQQPIDQIMTHLAPSSTLKSVQSVNGSLDIRAAAQSLIVFLIYFRVAPWSPDIKEHHEGVADTIVKQWIECLFDNESH